MKRMMLVICDIGGVCEIVDGWREGAREGVEKDLERQYRERGNAVTVQVKVKGPATVCLLRYHETVNTATINASKCELSKEHRSHAILDRPCHACIARGSRRWC